MKTWIGATLLLSVLIVAALVILFQRRFFYFPRRYTASEVEAAEKRGASVLSYQTSQGRQTAFMWGTPPSGTLLSQLWIVFGGNAMTALDWLDILQDCRLDAGGFLLVDYPGYGLCAGNPSTNSIFENVLGAYHSLLQSKRWILRQPHLSVLGCSIGTAPALQFAEKCPVREVVLIAPFTRMEDLVRRVIGIAPGMLLLDRFDNLTALGRVGAQTPPPKVTIIHGEKDSIIPIGMARTLAKSVSIPIEFHSVPEASHNSVLRMARELIYTKLQEGN
jgi:uncharacterized protein